MVLSGRGQQRPLNSRIGRLDVATTAFTRVERLLLIAAVSVACVVGGVAGYAAYSDEAEAQFHGGVLEEDAAEAKFALIWEATVAFARWGLGIFFAAAAPIAVRRLWMRSRR